MKPAQRNMSAKAKAVRAKHKAKVHASPEWAAKKAKVKATHAAKVKAKSAVKGPTGGSSTSSSPQAQAQVNKARKTYTANTARTGSTGAGGANTQRGAEGPTAGSPRIRVGPTKKGGGGSSVKRGGIKRRSVRTRNVG